LSAATPKFSRSSGGTVPRRVRTGRVLVAAALALSLWGPLAPLRPRAASGNGSPTENEQPEYQVKAAFLLNFIRYTTWPAKAFETPKSPIVLLVVGKDPFGTYLESTFTGEEIHGRTVEVRRSRDLPEHVEGHVVFCADPAQATRAELLKRCQKRPQLLVGESAGFAEEGACINFFLEGKKTHFEVNTEALAENGLELNPSVLRFAKLVKTRRENQEKP
jgi:hypothetical protein